jgi:polyferredoxin
MESVKKPTGLIRFASENQIAKSEKLKFNSRIIAYSVVLLALITSLGFMLASRDDVDITILRTSGSVYQQLPDGRVGNIYNAKLANKTHKDIPLTLKLENIKGEIEVIGKEIIVEKEGYKNATFIIKVNQKEIINRRTPINISFYENNKKIRTVSTTFIGPME